MLWLYLKLPRNELQHMGKLACCDTLCAPHSHAITPCCTKGGAKQNHAAANRQRGAVDYSVA